MPSDLKPCPFCGGEAERVDIEDGDNAGGSFVHCTVCDAAGNIEFEFKENFISNWNRRAQPAEAGVTVKTLEWVRLERNGILEEHWTAKTNLHQYADYEVYAQGQGVYRADFDGSRLKSGMNSPEEAKAAAQADYEQRVRSALHPTPAPQGMETAGEAWRQFKNFHRLLCERFEYSHDEKDWHRDQASLIEWIASRFATPQPAPSITTPWGWVCSGEGDGWKEADKLVRDPELVARYRGNPNWHTIVPLYPQPAPSGVNAEMLAALDDFIQGGENCSGPVNGIHLKHLREWRRAIAASETSGQSEDEGKLVEDLPDDADILLTKLRRKPSGRDPNKYLAMITVAEANAAAERLERKDAIIDKQTRAALDNRDVDWIDVTGWGAFDGHAIPVDVARRIAKRINLYHQHRTALAGSKEGDQDG